MSRSYGAGDCEAGSSWPVTKPRSTDEWSIAARVQSIRFAAFNLASRIWCIWSKTPASVQRCTRRQQVIPDPNPSSCVQALGIDYKSTVGHDAEIAKVMQRLNGLTAELANLRNRAGDGHGMSIPPAGLQLRHGRLAVRAAIAWCAFMLDTLHDQAAAEGQRT